MRPLKTPGISMQWIKNRDNLRRRPLERGRAALVMLIKKV
jgi:hypothetical protein